MRCGKMKSFTRDFHNKMSLELFNDASNMSTCK